MRWIAACLTALSLWLLAASASAQLAEGQRRLAQADFSRAIRAFDRAERGAHLTRDDLLAIYEGRAMARWATGDERHAARDLAALAELDPHHGFPPEAPPELGEAFDDAAREGGLELELTFADGAGTTTLNVDVHRDAAGLVRSLRTHVRVADGEWSDSDASTVRLDVPAGASVSAWVEAVGPGGAIVGRTGSEAAPIVHGGGAQHELVAPRPAPGPAPVAASIDADDDDADHDDSGLFIGLGVGIGVVVVAAVIIGVVVGVGSGSSDRTQPDAPIVRF